MPETSTNVTNSRCSISSVSEGTKHRTFNISVQQLQLLADIYKDPVNVIGNALRVARSLRAKGLATIEEKDLGMGRTNYTVHITDFGKEVFREKMRWPDENSCCRACQGRDG